MASFNKIVVVGYLGRDAEIRYLPDGTAVSNFSVATTEKRKDRSGESQETTTWFRVNLWGKQADALNQYLTKGRQVYVEGKLSQQEYTDRDGNRRTSLDIRASDVQLLGSRSDESHSGGSSFSSPARPSGSSAPQTEGDEPESDIPF